jgi:hypothetical protein
VVALRVPAETKETARLAELTKVAALSVPALIVPTVIREAATLAELTKVVALRVPAETKEAARLAELTKVVALRVPAETKPAARLAELTRVVALRVPAETKEAARLAELIKVVARRLPVVTSVATKFVDVIFVAFSKPVVMLVEPRVPLTVRVNAPDEVLIPTFPPVVKILPIVLEFPVAENEVLANTTPADTFVSTKLVEVILTTVKVPATFKLPDKWALAPLMVVAFNNAAPTVTEVRFPAVIVAATSVPAVIPVATTLVLVTVVANKLVDVILVAKTFPRLDNPDTRRAAIVAPVDKLIVLAETLVAKTFPRLDRPVTRRAAIVAPVDKSSEPELKAV